MSEANDNSGPKLVDLPKKPDEIAAAAENFKRNIETLLDHQRTLARLRRAAYLALIEAGFEEKQALELCCK